MNGIRIFFAWGLTVLIGSLIPAVLCLASGQPLYCIFILFMMFAGSALCSLPTLLVLLLVNQMNENKSVKTRLKRITLAHIIMLILTIIVGTVYTNDDYYLFAYVTLYYAIVGTVIWFVMFAKSWKTGVNPPNEIQMIRIPQPLRKELDF